MLENRLVCQRRAEYQGGGYGFHVFSKRRTSMATDLPVIGRKAGSLTYSVPEFARKLEIGKGKAYDDAKKKGEIAGVRVIRIGRLIRVPQAAADKLLNGEVA